jgi:CheY-like chemotaxis protein
MIILVADDNALSRELVRELLEGSSRHHQGCRGTMEDLLEIPSGQS